jgi:hypothetical protein
MRNAIFTLFFAISLIACKYHHGTSEDPLYNEVMAIHDEVMPKMTTMHAYKKELKKLKEQSPESKDLILKTIATLDNADEGMMSWMAEFKVPSDKNSSEIYLQQEKEKIQKVSDDMYNSMDIAKKLIDSLQSKQ